MDQGPTIKAVQDLTKMAFQGGNFKVFKDKKLDIEVFKKAILPQLEEN